MISIRVSWPAFFLFVLGKSEATIVKKLPVFPARGITYRQTPLNEDDSVRTNRSSRLDRSVFF